MRLAADGRDTLGVDAAELEDVAARDLGRPQAEALGCHVERQDGVETTEEAIPADERDALHADRIAELADEGDRGEDEGESEGCRGRIGLASSEVEDQDARDGRLGDLGQACDVSAAGESRPTNNRAPAPAREQSPSLRPQQALE